MKSKKKNKKKKKFLKKDKFKIMNKIKYYFTKKLKKIYKKSDIYLKKNNFKNSKKKIKQFGGESSSHIGTSSIPKSKFDISTPHVSSKLKPVLVIYLPKSKNSDSFCNALE